jgi:alanine racemase
MIHTSSILTVNLGAITANYDLLKEKLKGAECAAVVKADAYGLGVKQVADALYQSECRHFFVAHLDEAILLRSVVKNASIYVFHGVEKGQETTFWEYHLTPILNTVEQLKIWHNFTKIKGYLPYVLHVDTGMNRLGVSLAEACELAEGFKEFSPLMVMSHLACGGEKKHPMNKQQQTDFAKIGEIFPESQHSLANSAGIFLGAGYHFDIARPGCALYGVNPTPEAKCNPMKDVISLQGRMLQVREIKKGESVGYAASFTAKKNMKVATIGAGYADGYFRCLGNKGFAYLHDYKLPVIGRVSMDLTTVDVTAVPQQVLEQATHVELIGDHITVDDIAKKAGTIGYEVLTQLGCRYQRVYMGL